MTFHKLPNLVADSGIMRGIMSQLAAVAATDSSVLLVGETGVGKELLAEYIHRSSPRRERPFVKVGLSALPPELVESELFGHEPGAYTSASREKKGLFELAHTGSIFLDDIDDFPLHLQSKLLRILESRELLHVGGTHSIPIDARLITATKVDLREQVTKGLFRSDLFYRINVVPVQIPPLRDRREDIPLLIAHYVKHCLPDRSVTVADDAMKALVNYSWPGNIRELRNVIQRVSIFVDGKIVCSDLPPEISEENPLDSVTRACNRCFVERDMKFDEVMECLEINLLQHALRQTGGNRSHAARILGMSLSTLRDKLKKYHL